MNLTPLFSKKRSAAVDSLERLRSLPRTRLLKRTDIYDQETTWLSPWYMQLRVSEETSRAARYHRPLTLLVLESEASRSEDLTDWLSANLRSTDLASRQPDGRWFLLLPETEASGAYLLCKRIAGAVPLLSTAIAAFPEDEERFLSLTADLGSSELSTWLKAG